MKTTRRLVREEVRAGFEWAVVQRVEHQPQINTERTDPSQIRVIRG